MKIAYVITRSDSIGGAHVHLLDLASSARERGHEVTVFAGGDGPFFAELSARGIPARSLANMVRPIRPTKDLQCYFELRKELAALKPDLVALHSSKAGWIGRVCARRLGLPVVFTAHGWAFTEGVPAKERTVYRIAERLASPLADKIITVSEYDRQLALRLGVAPAEKLVTIHNGSPDVPPDLLARPEQEPPKLIMVARFEAPKDHALLLHALAALEDLAWTIEFVGDGPLKAPAEELSARLGIKERVQFSGTRRDIPERLATAQAFVLTSNWEGFPLTIVEAMRAGLPVVASRVGGVAEAVDDGRTGFTVPPGDAGALADRLRAIIQDASLRREMGRSARRRYDAEFTLSRMVERTLEVYRETVRRTRARRVS